MAAFATIYGRPTPLFSTEVILLCLIVLVVIIGRRRQVHSQWLESRFLAERFRSALFLKVVGLGNRKEGGFEGVNLADCSEDWLRRAYKYLWDRCPKVEVGPEQLESLRHLLVDGWIEPQIAYHVEKSHRHRHRHHQYSNISLALFAVTGVMALLHLVLLREYGDHVHGLKQAIEHGASLISITFPAIGSALAGIAAQREYQRHSAVFGRMSRYLASVKKRIGEATTLAEMQQAASDTDDIMGDENRDWLGVMKFHDFEIAG
jgi:hypothetical protein